MIFRDGVPLLIEVKLSEEKKNQINKRRVIYKHILEVCSEKLREKEKEKLLPIVEYFRTHDQIDRATAEVICGKSTTTTVGYLNRLVSIGVLKKEKESVATIYRIADFFKN